MSVCKERALRRMTRVDARMKWPCRLVGLVGVRTEGTIELKQRPDGLEGEELGKQND